MPLADDGIAALVLSALVLAHVLLSLRGVLCSGPRPSAAVIWQQLARSGHAVRTWTQRLVTYHHGAGASEEDSTARAVATLVADAVQQRKEVVREIYFRNFLHAASVLVVLLCVYIMRRDGPPMSLPLYVLSSASYLVLFLHQHCPGTRSWQTARLLIAAIICIALVVQVFYPPSLPLMLIFRFGVTMPARITGSIIVMDTPYVCVINALSSVLFCIPIYGSEGLDELPGMRLQICLADVLATLFICAFARFVEDNFITSCRLAIELKASKSEAYATAKVLNAMCDAVVYLDENLRVATADASLAALLLHGRGCTQAGSDFLQYLHNDADHQLFRDWLKASPSRCEEHVAFETRLRDSTGSAIAVEMFNVPFETITDATRNFIGIREKVPAGIAPPHGDQGRVNDDGVAALREFAGAPRRQGRLRRSSASSDSSSSSDSPPSFFQFGALTMEILGYSPRFSAFGHYRPPPKGSNLLDEIPVCDVNTEFARSYDLWTAAMMERSQNLLYPVEVEFDSAIVFRLGPNNDWYRVYVNVKLSSTREPGAELPCAVGTAKVLSVIRERDCPAISGRPEPLRL